MQYSDSDILPHLLSYSLSFSLTIFLSYSMFAFLT